MNTKIYLSHQRLYAKIMDPFLRLCCTEWYELNYSLFTCWQFSEDYLNWTTDSIYSEWECSSLNGNDV